MFGPEGSGKSLILEAISFCFFGSVALRDVASSYKQVEIELVFNYLGVVFKIVRKISDALLYIQDDDGLFVKTVVGTTAVNQKIISLFGYDYSIYVLSNYCQQGELQSFSKMTPAKKVAFIDKVSGVDDAKEFIKFLESRKKTLKAEISVTKKLITKPTEIDSSLLGIDYEVEIQNYEDIKSTLLRNTIRSFEIQKELIALTSELATLNNTPSNADVAAVVDYFKSDVKEFEKALKEHNENVAKLSVLLKSIKHVEDAYKIDVPYTLEQLLQFYEDIKYNTLVQAKKDFLANELLICPECSHEFRNTSQCSFDITTVGDTLLVIPKRLNQMYDYLVNHKENYVTCLDQYETLSLQLNPLIKKLPANKDLISLFTSFVVFQKHWDERTEYLEGAIELLNKELDQVSDVSDNSELETITNHLYTLTKNKFEVDVYTQSKLLYDTAITQLSVLESEFNSISQLIIDCISYSDKIKKEAIPLINHHASVLLNNMTDSVLSKLIINESYDIFVNSKNINVCCGSEKDTASLAFRLSLGNSIILGMLPLFLGDEIDSSSRMERSVLITDVLQNMSDLGYQVLLITHKDTSNFENCNIINLQELL